MGYREDMDTLTVDERHTLLVDSRAAFYRSDPVAKQWWLLRDNIPVAYLQTLTYPEGVEGECNFQLCDIEVRPEQRGQGLTRILIDAVEKTEGFPIWTSGHFTPLGAQALGWLRVKPWETVGIFYDDMTFVRDWDALHSKNPL